MSFDIVIFDMDATGITTRAAFTDWFGKFTDWSDDRGYDITDGSTEPIAGFYREIIKDFPPMNGPLAGNDDDDELDDAYYDNPKVTDYSIGVDGIYAAVAYSQAEVFSARVMELAPQFNVGFNFNRDPEAIGRPDGQQITE